MPKSKSSKRRLPLLRIGVSVVLLAGAAVVLAANRDVVERSFRAARHADVGWLGIALALVCLTYAIAAAIYMTLALHRLRYRPTLLVEASTAFVNRLLPSGIGGLGVHGLYLYKHKHTAAEATAVVTVNNLLGMAAHLLILAITIAFYPSALHELASREHIHLNPFVAGGVLALVLVVLSLSAVRRNVAKFGRNLSVSIRQIGWTNTANALLLAGLLTTTYTSILFATARSVGVQLGVVQVFIVFSIGMLTSTATPTPGGLVGAEAGLFVGFVAYGTTSPVAGAAVLLYRLATYWLPLLPGVAALLLARNRKLL